MFIHTYIHTVEAYWKVPFYFYLLTHTIIVFLQTTYYIVLYFNTFPLHLYIYFLTWLDKNNPIELVLPMKKFFHGELLKLKLHCPLGRIERMSKMAITCKHILFNICCCCCCCEIFVAFTCTRSENINEFLYHLVTYT